MKPCNSPIAHSFLAHKGLLMRFFVLNGGVLILFSGLILSFTAIFFVASTSYMGKMKQNAS
jgi:hypothetical protein